MVPSRPCASPVLVTLTSTASCPCWAVSTAPRAQVSLVPPLASLQLSAHIHALKAGRAPSTLPGKSRFHTTAAGEPSRQAVPMICPPCDMVASVHHVLCLPPTHKSHASCAFSQRRCTELD